MYNNWSISTKFKKINFKKNNFSSFLVSKQKEENDGKYLMSIVKINTLDRTLIINNENPINEFTTRLNLHGKFIHIDSKFDFVFFFLSSIKILF
jgi:hypothetical protein